MPKRKLEWWHILYHGKADSMIENSLYSTMQVVGSSNHDVTFVRSTETVKFVQNYLIGSSDDRRSIRFSTIEFLDKFFF